jgi:hypothetical protein
MKTLKNIYFDILSESEASEKAKKMGLHHVGFGNYQTKSGKVTYRYDDQQNKFIKVGQSDNIDDTEDTIKKSDIGNIKSFKRSIVAKTDPRKEEYRMNQKLYEDKNYPFYIDKNKLSKEQFILKKDVPFKSEKHKNILQHNARKLISQVSTNLDSGEINLLYEYSAKFSENCVNAGISVNNATKLFNDNIGKLLYQEEESRGRQFGDHGIRHVIGDILYADKFVTELNKLLPEEKKLSNRRRLLMDVVLLNHDMGYTVKDVREDPTFKNSISHPAISMKMFVHDLSNGKYNSLHLKQDEVNFIKAAITTHDNKTIDWNKQPELSAIRLSDNMGLFQKEKLPYLFSKVEGSQKILEDLHKDCKENKGNNRNKLIKQLMFGVTKTNLPNQTKHSLLRAARETNCFTAKVTLGMWAGEIDTVKFDKNENGKIYADIKIKHNQYNKKLQEAGFNLGGDKFKKFAETLGVTNLQSSNHLELKDDMGNVVLKSDVIE